MNFKKLEIYLGVNLLGPGPRLLKKRIYRAAVSQRLRNTVLEYWHFFLNYSVYYCRSCCHVMTISRYTQVLLDNINASHADPSHTAAYGQHNHTVHFAPGKSWWWWDHSAFRARCFTTLSSKYTRNNNIHSSSNQDR